MPTNNIRKIKCVKINYCHKVYIVQIARLNTYNNIYIGIIYFVYLSNVKIHLDILKLISKNYKNSLQIENNMLPPNPVVIQIQIYYLREMNY